MMRDVWRWVVRTALVAGAASLPAQAPPPVRVAVPPTPVAARELARDATIARDDIAGDSTAADSIVGWVARRLIRAGEPLRPPAVGRRPLVTAGSDVTVVATVDGVSVSRGGTAVSAGAMGQRIRVRLDGTRIVVATVTGPAEARIP